MRCLTHQIHLHSSPSDIKGKVQALQTGSTTALGPALALCVGMASNFPSAEVILCTDGVSNVGVGNLEGGRSDSGFYSTVRACLKCSCTVPIVAIAKY